MNHPKVSIIIPAHNGEKFLRPAVQSVISQGIRNMELIIVDDASTDSSLRQIQDLPVQIIKSHEQMGTARAINRALEIVRGEFITILDQDDKLVPDSLARRLAWLGQNKKRLSVLGTVAQIVDESSKILDRFSKSLRRKYESLPNLIDWQYIARGGWFPMNPLSTGLFHRRLLQEVGYLDEKLTRAHDRDYFYRILVVQPVLFINQAVLTRRWHRQNLSLRCDHGRLTIDKRTIAESHLVDKYYGVGFTSYT